MIPDLESVWIDERIENEAWTKAVIRRIRSLCPDAVIENVSEGQADQMTDGISLTRGKRILYITAQKGGLVKPCPATNPPYLCCRYTVINQGTQCPMDCTYCVLQGYLDAPVMILNVNREDIFREIDRQLSAQPGRFFRFGTGELADSLALDAVTRLSGDYLSFFSKRRNALIELKTKTVQIGGVLRGNPKHAVLSWSVNPRPVIARQEYHAAGLDERLEAARQCQDQGFLLGFHFDPILFTDDWERLYTETVDALFSRIDARRIAWISLGSLRFPPELKPVIQNRFPGCRIVTEEMIRGLDSKMRYPRPLRIGLYRGVYNRIREKSDDVFVYFCMEPPDVWNRVMGFSPRSNADLDYRFAATMHKRFPGLDMDEPLPLYYPEPEKEQSKHRKTIDTYPEEC